MMYRNKFLIVSFTVSGSGINDRRPISRYFDPCINTIYVQGTNLLSTDLLQVVTCRHKLRAANYCRTSDNVPLNLSNVRAKVILIGHWSDHKKIVTLYIFCCDKIRCKFTQFAFCNKIYEAF
jgi:hypothetical protein